MAVIENPVEDSEREIQVVMDKTEDIVPQVVALLKSFYKKYNAIGYYCTGVKYAAPEMVIWHLVFSKKVTDDMTEEIRQSLVEIDSKFGYGGAPSGSPVSCPCR
jgi:hypothetical protein